MSQIYIALELSESVWLFPSYDFDQDFGKNV